MQNEGFHNEFKVHEPGLIGIGTTPSFAIPIYLHEADRQWVSFMYSHPNLIPLPATEIKRIQDTIAPYPFERLYGAWFERIVTHDAHAVVLRSADRYIHALESLLHTPHEKIKQKG